MLDNKVEAMEKAKEYEFDYWDGSRRYGYGGYKFIDGRWKKLAEKLIERFQLTSQSTLLDVGCGKGFLLLEIQKILPGVTLYGIDVSMHALENLHPELKISSYLISAASKWPFELKQFDLVISINTLHNLKFQDLEMTLTNMTKFGKDQYIVVESFRNSLEQFNLECWALTANLLLSKDDWIWTFKQMNYQGDFEFIYFQ
jgi:ubiquinone/menaquinone biosynthesis C-methylase UbiE